MAAVECCDVEQALARKRFWVFAGQQPFADLLRKGSLLGTMEKQRLTLWVELQDVDVAISIRGNDV